jgi:hypothetical protein
MAVCFQQSQELTRGDLDLFLTNAVGNPTNAYSVVYSIFCVDPTTCNEILIGTPDRTPVNPAIGEYYAALQVPPNAKTGTYRIRWNIQESAGSPLQQVVQEFCVTSSDATTSTTTLSECEQELVNKLRFMLRDRNPDRNYRFRPPEGEGVVGCFNQVFGFIWEDEELLEFMEIALWKWNSAPPETEELCDLNTLCSKKPTWRAAILWGGIVNAAMALAINWIADEFDYSIGGISLNIEKSSKYMDIKRNAEEQFDKMKEDKARATKFMRGLSQPRFGRGIRSAFGPHVGRGVLSPRNFV